MTEKSELTIINDTSSLSVVNDIKVGSLAGSITTIAKENLSTTTVSGITSFISGDKLNMKSVNAMVINAETSTIDSTAGTVYTIKSGGGSPTSTNKVDINP